MACTGRIRHLSSFADARDLEKALLEEEGKVPMGRNRSSSCGRIPSLERSIGTINTPGGFRRHFLNLQADLEGRSAAERPPAWSEKLTTKISDSMSLHHADVLEVFEHKFGVNTFGADAAQEPAEQHLHLLGTFGCAAAIFKGNCGPAVLFMPAAWRTGGWLFSSLLLPVVCMVSTMAAFRLIEARGESSMGYSDMMMQAIGPVGRRGVETSLVLLQVGICCCYFITTAQLLQSALLPGCSIVTVIVAQVWFLAPVVLIRKVTNLWMFNATGSILVILSDVVVTTWEAGTVHRAGVRWDELRAFNSSGALVFLGNAFYAFEGIGLVLPIYDCMQDKNSFHTVYGMVLGAITMLIVVVGMLGYSAFGADVQTLVLVQFEKDLWTDGVRCAFAFAVMCTFQLQLLPALNLLEKWLIPPSRAHCWSNLFRVSLLVLMALVAIVGSSSLDHFVSLVGAFCGIPLALIYPAICHLKLSKAGVRSKAVDVVLIVIGCVLTVVVSAVSITEFY